MKVALWIGSLPESTIVRVNEQRFPASCLRAGGEALQDVLEKPLNAVMDLITHNLSALQDSSSLQARFIWFQTVHVSRISDCPSEPAQRQVI